MHNKLVCTCLIILFVILLFIIFNQRKTYKIENFASSGDNKWTTDKDKLAADSAPLNDVQRTEVSNMVTSKTTEQLKNLISTQSPLLTGPQGPQGIQGPPGTSLIASGRLVNKNGSYDKTADGTNYFNPKYIVSRTEGTNSTSSLSFMDTVSPFVSFQNWQLDVNNNLKNRYDGTCLTINKKLDGIYMDKCSDDIPNQKWSWDSTNRIISTTASTDSKLKCMGLTNPETNVITTSIPGCKGNECMNNSPRRYLTIKDCDINQINDDEIWSFI